MNGYSRLLTTQGHPSCSADQRGRLRLAMMNPELIPKSATTYQMSELPSSPLPLFFKARAMNVHASSTGLALDEVSSLAST
jgi:hypothetical protein